MALESLRFHKNRNKSGAKVTRPNPNTRMKGNEIIKPIIIRILISRAWR